MPCSANASNDCKKQKTKKDTKKQGMRGNGNAALYETVIVADPLL